MNDPYLVRGLDYYTGVVFEANHTQNNLQTSFLGGGRYDDLISNISNHTQNIPAIGFAIGVERFLKIIKEETSFFQKYFLNNSKRIIFVFDQSENY
jgi:histidyl-tRNA synthetase